MSKVKNQHFVPQFYLKNFSSNKKQIFVFDKINNKQYPSAIDSVASSRFFYDWNELDEIVGKQFIESTFSIFEGEASVAFAELISRTESDKFRGFIQEEKSLISEFIWYQMIRTPEARIQGDQLAKTLEESLRSRGFDDSTIKSNGVSYEDSDARLDHLRMIIKSSNVQESIGRLCERIWIVVENKTKYQFYTSDNPVLRYTHHDRAFGAYEIFYPLTPKFSIMILNRRDFQDFISFDNKIMPFNDKEFVKWYNSLQVVSAGRQIFSIENDFRLAQKMLKTNPSLMDPNRPRIKIM